MLSKKTYTVGKLAGIISHVYHLYFAAHPSAKTTGALRRRLLVSTDVSTGNDASLMVPRQNFIFF